MVTARMELNEYSNRVLNVVKAKFNLKDKSDALNRFIEEFGDEYAEREVKDEYVKKILAIEDKHKRLHGNRKMTLKELDKLCGVNDV